MCILRKTNHFPGKWNIKGVYFPLPSGPQVVSSTLKPLQQPHGRRKVSLLVCSQSSLEKKSIVHMEQDDIALKLPVLSAFSSYEVQISSV